MEEQDGEEGVDGVGEGGGVQVEGQIQTSPAPAITIITKIIIAGAGEDKVEEEVS